MSNDLHGASPEVSRAGQTASSEESPGASALIAQLFRQVLRLQPRNERPERGGRGLFPDVGGDHQADTPAFPQVPLPQVARDGAPPPAVATPATAPGLGQGQAQGEDAQTRRIGDPVRALVDRPGAGRPGVGGPGGPADLGGRIAGREPAHGEPAFPEVAPPQASSDVHDSHRAAKETLDHLSGHLQRLCQRGGQISQQWSATLQLDPTSLPDTRLRIQASQSWLRLRFSTQSADSLRLISDHSPALRNSLEQSLDLKDQVDIDFE